jgi:hypothetical protein
MAQGTRSTVVSPSDRGVMLFLVERSLSELTPDGQLGIHKALTDSCRRLSVGARKILYQESFFVAERGWCLSTFIATDKETVQLANDVAQVPFVRIDEGLNLENLDS